jgi:acid phosphatase (class A)
MNEELALSQARTATQRGYRAPPVRPVHRGLGSRLVKDGRPVFSRARQPLFAAILAVVASVGFADSAPPPRYFDTGTLDLTRVLPPPPANDSAETRGDLDEMLVIQKKRSAAESQRAVDDVPANIYRFAEVLGNPAGFNAKNLPLTDAMFRKVLGSELSVVGAAKKYYGRPRPFLLEPQLQPLIEKPGDGSYPSGHSSWVRAVALVLADMIPERRAQIIARANEYARNRVVAGVHYPSDIEAGKLAGTAIAAALYISPDFRTDLAAATTELRQALSLPAVPAAARPAAAPGSR